MRTTPRTLIVGIALALLGTGIVVAQGALKERLDLDAARDAMADRTFPEAARKLANFLRSHPGSKHTEEVHVLLMRAKAGIGDDEGVLEAGRRFLGEFHDSASERKVRFLMADAFSRMRGFKDAARIYRQQLDFLSGDVHLGKVAGYYAELARHAYEGEEKPDQFGRKQLVKDFRRALTYYRKARGIFVAEKDKPEVTYRIGMSLFQLGDRNGAVNEWKGLLKEWPEAAQADDATYHIGYALFLTNQDVEARRYLRELREKWGDSEWAPHALIVLGESHRMFDSSTEEDLTRRLAYWKKFRELHPSHEKAEEVFYQIGESEYLFGRYDNAIEEMERYLEAFPDAKRSPLARNMIAASYLQMFEFDKAIAEWKKFLGQWPNHELWTKVQGNIALAALMKGLKPLADSRKASEKEKPALWDRAEQGFKSFLATYSVHPRAGEAQYLIAEIQHLRKQYDEAIAQWRITRSKFAETRWASAALYRIGETYEKNLNDLAKAIETYEELVKAYAASGEARTARKLLDQFRKKLLEVKTERVFRTDQTVKVRVRTRNVENLKIRAYPLNLEDRFREKQTLGEIEKVVVQVRKAAHEKTVPTPEFEKYRLFDREIDLAKLNRPGAWIVTFQEKDLTATTLVVVSDLSIVTKQSPDQTLVFAVNERTGEPFPGVRVLLSRGGKIQAEGRTKNDGVYVRSGSSAGQMKYFAEANGHVAFAGLSAAGRAGFGYSTKAYIYTDRPLYRPGHEVKLKGIYRRVSRGSYVTSDKTTVALEIRDPSDTVVFKKDVTTNDFGTFAAEAYLADSAAVGTYRILAVVKNVGTFTGNFEVREFKKPEFTITAKSDRRTYLPGEEVKISLSLRYFFGGPVPETLVRYRVGRTAYAFDPSVHEEFAWFTMDPARERERERRAQAGVNWLSEGQVTTDKDGNAEITVKTEDLDADLRYVVAFEALDLNRQWVRESTAATVTRKGRYVLAKTEKKVYRPGEEITVDLTTVDAIHFPVKSEGELHVARRRYEGNRETETIVEKLDAKTGEDGRGKVRVKVARSGEYRLKFVTKDRAGNEVIGGALVTISGESEDLDKHAKVVASRQIYREGDTAEVLVNSPVAPVWALLTFEGERVLDYKVVRLTERSTTLNLLMKPEYSPNVFVKIAIPSDAKLHQAFDEIYVFKYLEVEVAAGKAEVKPGEKVSFTVKTTDQRGKPVPAETSLALIDQSVLALQPDGTPQIKPFFYDQRRVLVVTTGSSSNFKYHGVTGPTNKDLLWEEMRRLGPEKFNRTMKYVGAAKQFMARGDLEGAAIELRKALSVSPLNYEAGDLLARVETQLEVRRQAELAKKLATLAEKRAESKGPARGYYGGPSGGGGGRYKGPGGEVPPGAREPADDAPMPEPTASAERIADRFADKELMSRLKAVTKNGRTGADWTAKLEELEMEDQDAKAFVGLIRTAGRMKVDEADGARFLKVFDSLDEMADLRQDFDVPLVPATLRKRFADTAAWRPHVVTGADGTATVEVELPDNLTTWRAVVRGTTRDTLVGEAQASVVARKNLLVRIDTPRFLTQRDRVTVTSTVHNNLPQAVNVGVELTGENITLEEPTKQQRKLDPRRIHPFEFELAAVDYGLGKVTANALTTVESDAAVTGFPVLPYGLRTFVGRSGEIEDEVYESFDLPDGIIPGTKDLVITLSPGIDGSILESVVYLGSYPYACLEQTVHRFLPAIAARQALRAVGSPNEKLKKTLDDAVERGLLALYAFQNPDGSFGWFSGRVRRLDDRKVVQDSFMTALAILGMERAREAGYRVSSPHFERAIAAGTRMVKGTRENREKSFLLFALARAGRANLEDLNQVYRYRDGLDSYSLATLALAMEETGRKASSSALVDLLKAKAIRDGGLIHWPGSGSRSRMNDVETTAFALRAMIRVERTNDMIDGTAKWLLTKKRGSRWTSTRDTGAAVLALADYLVAKGVGEGDFVVEVWLNDGKVPYQKLHVVGGKVADDQRRTVLIDGARLATGKNRIRFVKRGPGQLFYTMKLAYHTTPTAKIEGDGNLVKVGRRYLEYISPVAVKEGKKEIKPGWTVVRPEARPKEKTGETIELAGSGDKFRIRLEVDAREALPYVILEDPLPAGVEVVEGQSEGPFDREERRDEKQVFFLSNLPKGRTVLTYVVQAIHPGEFHAMPAMAWPMYEPEIWGRSAEQLLTIVRESGRAGKPTQPEAITPDEIYQVAVRDFAEKKWERARSALERLVKDFKLIDRFEEECHAMLMRANFMLGDHRRAVEAYERLREFNPRRGPKTREERRKLAAAYQGIGEFERSLALMKGVVGEHFALENEVVSTFRNIGQPHKAQELCEALVLSYPDLNSVVGESYRSALRYLELKDLKAPERPTVAGRVETGLMLVEGLEALRAFLAHYPATPFADEANRMIVTILSRMEDIDGAVKEGEKFIRRHQQSAHLDDVYFYLTESWFNAGKYDKVFEIGKKLLDGHFRPTAGSKKLVRSPYRYHVIYLFAKVHHLKGNFAEAVRLYDQVKNRFEDARDAYGFLTSQQLFIPESVSFGVGEKVMLPVKRKNLTALDLRIYDVDLMLLIAVKKNLRAANEIDLTGVPTENRVAKEWKQGKDFRWHEEEVPLGLEKKGVYLVVARAHDLVDSTIVIVSDLDMSVQIVGDKVRVYAIDKKTRQPRQGVFVKIADGKEIKAQGFTDARGVFEGRGVSGSVMVVAEQEGDFALYRR